MPTLAITDQDLRYEVGRLLHWGPVSEWTTEDQSDYTHIKENALRQFYHPPLELTGGVPYVWSFLQPLYTLNTDALYETGTITIASGVVTLAGGGTFPTWAADGELIIVAASASNSSGPFEVSTRDSNTQVTLVDTSVTQATASSYKIQRYRYDLPSNYGGRVGPLTYRTADFNYDIQEIDFISYEEFLLKRQNWQWNSSNQTRKNYKQEYPLKDNLELPRYATEAVKRVQYEGADNTDYAELTTRQLLLWPTPTAEYFLSMEYIINAQTLDPDEILGGEVYPLAVRNLVLAEAERSKDHPTPKYQEAAASSLAQAVRMDKARYDKSPDNLGYNRDRSDKPMRYDPWYYRTNIVTHEDDV